MDNPQHVEIFRKTYNGESTYDLSRDILECFDPVFNAKAKALPEGDAFLEAEFEVVVLWKPQAQE